MLPPKIETWLSELPDPRTRHTRYSVGEIVFLVLSGLMAGQSTLVDIEDWGEANHDWLRQYFPYRDIPSHDTLGRVLGLMHPKGLAQIFQELAEAMSQHWQAEGSSDHPRHVALDGKALRGSYQKNTDPQIVVQAWDRNLGVFLGMHWVESKENEILGSKALADALNLKNVVVTADAMHTQKALAKVIVEKGGHLVVPVKDNQPELKKSLALLLEKPPQGMLEKQETHVTHEKQHGRLETRDVVWQPLSLKALEKEGLGLQDWPVKGAVKITRTRRLEERTISGTYETRTSSETQFYLSTWNPQALPNENRARIVGEYIRGHWDVEKTHYILDTAFREDQDLCSDPALIRHLAELRRVALTFLGRSPEPVQKRAQKKDKVLTTWKAKMKQFDRSEKYRDQIWQNAGKLLLSPKPKPVIRAKI